ncbi:ferritin-like domain-containing protein [Mucilaginibacter sp. PPCGB 2223]|uniref:ferritin-like domain-containing protein n=1 Tax=Mucilaginibacter sp. PPCGB 2223 TaxID=1886027 RepID=UPI0009F3FBCB|nr:ferritin-like domain-containing protein [Mucilaginibacter sp. PPCGB 2223]
MKPKADKNIVPPEPSDEQKQALVELEGEKADIFDAIAEKPKDLFDRDPKYFETDKACVEAIIQQCVNVELFTIPLYMTSLYSIQGMHQINSKDTAMYVGKIWPGLAPTFRPGTSQLGNIPENQEAFNTVFSVFIEEMFHLQLASNIATALKVKPKFTELSPKDKNYAWQCYNSTAIPGIVDFQDCEPWSGGVHYKGLRVELDELNYRQNDLFLAIEAPEKECKMRIRKDKIDDYFPTVPFKKWQKGDALPWFGSIGHMYQCLWDYLDVEYSDGTTLMGKMYSPTSIQQDLFNTVSSGHPYKEFQQLETTIEGFTPGFAKDIIYKLICAITDQGEGAGITRNIRPKNSLLQRVQVQNQANYEALEKDYPSYTQEGKPAPSAHAYARAGGEKPVEQSGRPGFDNGTHDHYERFEKIRRDIESGKLVTWPKWHEQRGPNAWKPEDLMGQGYNEANPKLPTAAEIAGALNRLNSPDEKKRAANYKQFCEIATGAIAGITTVLDQYWIDSSVAFPFPSMGGSGDRLMMCWAVFGELPDLATPIQPRQKDKLYHACQGLDLNTENPDDPNVCASPEVYHNCRGSNSCKAEGGCGFVQLVGQSKSCGGSSSCGPSMAASKSGAHLCGTPKPAPSSCGAPSNCSTPKPPAAPFSAPGDNLCGSFGGCAVPISASQIYPAFSDANGNPLTHSTMELNDFPAPDFKIKKLDGDVPFAIGDFVYDIAWDAYTKVIESRNKSDSTPVAPPVKPKPSDIRLAFPPST